MCKQWVLVRALDTQQNGERENINQPFNYLYIFRGRYIYNLDVNGIKKTIYLCLLWKRANPQELTTSSSTNTASAVGLFGSRFFFVCVFVLVKYYSRTQEVWVLPQTVRSRTNNLNFFPCETRQQHFLTVEWRCELIWLYGNEGELWFLYRWKMFY